MFGQSDPSKTEKGTKKQRDKARDDGNVPRSQEMSKSTVLLAGLIYLTIFMDSMTTDILDIFRWFLSRPTEFEFSPNSIYELFILMSERLAVILLPILLTLMVTAFLTQRFQVGSLWTTKVMKPKFAKIFNILSGIKKFMINPKTLLQMVKSLLQAFFIGLAPYLVLKQELAIMPTLFDLPVAGVAAYIMTTGGKMVLYALIPMLIISIADVAYTRWDYEEQLKMTKDEVKDERKQMEGDPEVKRQQKEKMLQSMAMRMMEKVPEADVVITNPTHFAVALKYDPLVAPAPLVLAKGADSLAQKIKEVARENNVPIRENKPLAQALYKSVEIGETIPEELFQAVASILAQIFKYKKR